jgi:hypothetical protein
MSGLCATSTSISLSTEVIWLGLIEGTGSAIGSCGLEKERWRDTVWVRRTPLQAGGRSVVVLFVWTASHCVTQVGPKLAIFLP